MLKAIVLLGVILFMVIGCERDPQLQRKIRIEIPRSKVQRARAKAIQRRAQKLAAAALAGKVTTQATNIGDRFIFCGGIAVTADDIVADGEAGDPNSCSFQGIQDPFTQIVGQDVSFTPGQIFGLVGDGTGTAVQSPFNQSDTIIEDDDSGGGDLVVEFQVEPGDDRQFNVMIFDINTTQTGFTNCEDFFDNGGIFRMEDDNRNGQVGHMTLAANFITVVSDVSDGVTEIVVEDGNSEDTEIEQCCGSLFNESCSDL